MAGVHVHDVGRARRHPARSSGEKTRSCVVGMNVDGCSFRPSLVEASPKTDGRRVPSPAMIGSARSCVTSLNGSAFRAGRIERAETVLGRSDHPTELARRGVRFHQAIVDSPSWGRIAQTYTRCLTHDDAS
jgi:hypothetical protein